ncbi:MAG: exopolysaccharide biosynthesis polyprenyl glycosylphosphotransferase [Cellvibrionaceae bacterium]|jgi:exopolysaccharide biosynthesis polyprenyl glycosylphosphotransferase
MGRGTRPVRTITFLTDIVFILAAFYLGWFIRYELEWLQPVETYHPFVNYIPQLRLYFVLIVLAFWQNLVWRRRRGELFADEMMRVISAVSMATAIMIIYIFVTQPLPFSRLFWAFVPLSALSLIFFGRILRKLLLLYLYSSGRSSDKVLLIGKGETGRSVLRTLIARKDLGFSLVGYMHDGEANDLGVIGSRIPDKGDFDNLSKVLQEHKDLHSVFIALPGNMYEDVMRLIRICRNSGVRVQVAPDLFQLSLSRVESISMGGIPILSMREVRISLFERFIKRFIDLFITLIIALPVAICCVFIAIAIRLDSTGPVIYRAKRVGQGGRDFVMFKFRSMIVGADEEKPALQEMNEKEGPIFKIREDPRLTRVGRIIRRLSLDEFPQLYNVLLGDMSLVGPRPPIREEVEQYQAWHRQRLLIRGGITGLWQVSGRSDLTFDEQALLDIYYIENWSFSLDLRILLQTIPYALFGRGAY